jgi:hypothetical protein
MNWSRNSSWHLLPCLCLLAAVVLGVAGSSPAQESFDQRLSQATDLFNNAKMEDACTAFQQLDKEKPGDKQVQAYLKMSCKEVNRLQKTEEDLFNQGVQLFNQGQLDDARQKFEQVGKFQGLKEPRYRSKALDYIKKIDARQGEEHTFQEAVALFNAGKYKDAQTRFNPIAQGGGTHANDARNYLTKIDAAISAQKDTETFAEGVRSYNAHDYESAKSDFEKVFQAGGPKAAEAQVYLKKIEQAQIKPPQPPPTNPNEPPPPPTSASEQSLRAGLKAYFAGDLDAAERDLSDYLKQNGPKQSLAYFFRGATHSTRYFLSGENNSHEMELAIDDFQSAKTRDRDFQPPSKYIPPKILALYSVAESPPSR